MSYSHTATVMMIQAEEMRTNEINNNDSSRHPPTSLNNNATTSGDDDFLEEGRSGGGSTGNLEQNRLDSDDGSDALFERRLRMIGIQDPPHVHGNNNNDPPHPPPDESQQPNINGTSGGEELQQEKNGGGGGGNALIVGNSEFDSVASDDSDAAWARGVCIYLITRFCGCLVVIAIVAVGIWLLVKYL